jgi:zinc protease
MTTNNHPHSLPSSTDVLRIQLPNGITVLARANYSSPSVTLSGYLEVGALFDPPDRLGLAEFTSLALMRGTAAYSFDQIFDLLETAGASFGYNGGTHTTGFGGKALAEDLPLLLHLLNETLRSPTFPAEEIERLRAQILTHLAIQAQDTAEIASLTFDQIVYAGHPYSQPEEGTPETVNRITRQDLVDFHQRNYGPRGMVIAVVGAIEPQRAVDLVAEQLGDWRNPAQPAPIQLPPVTPLKQQVSRYITLAGKSQADLIIGAPGPKRRDPAYYAAALGNSILGQFGMYGRIGDVVRERNGLAYYAYSSLSGGIGPGPWYIAAGTDPQNSERAVELIIQEIRRFTQELVDPDELADSQANFIGHLPLSLESNSGVAAALINLERYELDLDFYLRFADLVNSVTREEILEVARRCLNPDRLGIAIAGPRRKFEAASQKQKTEGR